MKTAIRMSRDTSVKFACRQEQVCPDCGRVYRQQKSRRVKCSCGRAYDPETGASYNSGRGLLTQRTVRYLRKELPKRKWERN